MKTITLEVKQEFYDNGQIRSEAYFLNNELHNENGFASKYWYEDGRIQEEIYCLNGKRHNENGSAFKYFYTDKNH